jgi:hypothetical protein
MRKTGFLIGLLLLVCVFSCKQTASSDSGSSSGGTVDDAASACGGPTQGCVIGNVLDADSGGVVSEVIVSTGGIAPSASLSKSTGTTVATANAQGWFFVSNIEAAEAVTFCFQHADYVTLCRNIQIIAQSTINLPPVLMTPRALTQTIDAAAGGTIVNATTGAQLVISASSVCAADGTTAVNGDVECALTGISSVGAMPGDSVGTRLDATAAALMFGGLLQIACADAIGAELALCTGQTATVRIPVLGYQECGDLVNPMPSWIFDEGTGLWNENATFVKSCGGGETTSYFEGLVNSFGWWAAAAPSGFACLTGNVVDTVTDNPNTEALVECTMSSGAGKVERARFSTWTDVNGDFCAQVPVTTYYSCTAKKAQFSSNTQLGETPITELPCGHIACKDVGGFSLEDPILRTTLTWLGEIAGVPRDIDSYFMSTDGTIVVYYGDKGSLVRSPFVELDTDAVSWSGPENVTAVPGMYPGTYRFCVHNFSGDGDLTTSGAEVLVSGLSISLPRRYNIPTSPVNRLVWKVYEVVVAEDYSMTLTDINVLAGSLDADEVAVCLQ